jgi:uncharacterized membrane protein
MEESSQILRELAELREAVRELTGRVFALEQGRTVTTLANAETALPLATKPSSPQGLWEPLSAPIPPKAAEASLPRHEPAPVPQKANAAVPPPVRPSLESRIGSQWLNQIGITALLIGVSYFLKFAFDNNWIGPAGRVAIGLFLGVLVVVWSERFRSRGHKTFSHSLKAVGIGTLYLSLWAAFQLYGLVPSGVAFLAMVIVTSATVVMAWTQDAEILAAFALAGGFSTPLLLSTGQNHEFALFAYVALLDLAALFLVVARPWRRLLWMSYSGTLLLYLAWDAQYYHGSEFTLTAAFATLFLVIFAIAAIVARNPRGRRDSPVGPALLSVVNAAVYFLQMYIMLEDIDKTSSAWVALVLAAFYIYLSRMRSDRYGDPASAQTLRLLHLALAVWFITIAIPIYLNSHWITMGWFVEAAVLLWVSGRLKSELLMIFSMGALVLGVLRLLVFDNFATSQVIFNPRMATYAVAVSVLGLLVWHGRKRGDEAGEQMASVSSVVLNVLALWALGLEVRDFFGSQMTRASGGYPNDWRISREIGITRDFTYSALWMGYGGMLMVMGFLKRSSFIRWQALALMAATICKVFVYDVSSLDKGYRIMSFVVLGALLMGVSFVYQRDWLKLSKAAQGREPANLS